MSAGTERPASTRWWDLPAALLLIAILATAAGRLVATRWVDHLSIVRPLAFLGAVAGLALGQSHFSRRWVITFSLTYGLFTVPWQLRLALGYTTPWNERLADLVGRMGIAFDQLLRQEAVPDPLLFLVLMAALSWGLSVHAGYILTRHGKPWRIILPPVAAMFIIHVSDLDASDQAWMFAVYFLFSLLLLARMAYRRSRARWLRTGTFVPPHLGLEMGRIVLLVATLSVLAAWVMPAMAFSAVPAAQRVWQWIARPWDSVGEFMSNAFASLEGEGRDMGSYYDESLTLGRGAALGDALVLNVRAPFNSPPAGVRYYWRARVYDRYVDGQWTSTLSARQPIQPGGLDHTLDPQSSQGRLAATFIFTPTVDVATLYAAPQPLWVTRHARADLAYNPDGTTDLSALHATPHVRADEAYAARSYLSAATIAQLRAAGTDYPAWVTDRYLQLPITVTPRTRELAREIAADMDNPYDIAVAVTDYLRVNIEYVEIVDAPLEGQDPLDYVLFDSRQGFCSYYASAEVVLLRSLGIPARLAAGFAQGTRQGQSGVYVVRQRDAHAWPEVYFPGLGWIEFEPTVSQPPLSRPSGEEQPQTEAETSVSGETEEEAHEGDDRFEDRLEELLTLGEGPSATPSAAQRLRWTANWALPLALGLGLAALAWRVGRQRGLPPLPVLLERGLRRYDVSPPIFLRLWAIWATQSTVGRAYLALNQALVRLGASPAPWETPGERAAKLARLLPAAAVSVQRLLVEYHIEVYSPRAGDEQTARQAGRAIRALSWRSVVSTRVERLLRPLAFVVRRLTASHHSPW